jgi:hypothetical protein
MFRSLVCAFTLLLLSMLFPAQAAAQSACTDFEHCSAVRNLAEELKVKPTPAPRPVIPPQPPSHAMPPQPSSYACSPEERRAAAAWPKLKSLVVQASTAVVNISRCAACRPEAVSEVEDVWGRSMVRYVRLLSCAREGSRDEATRSEVVEEFRRVFSGAMVAGAGDATALLALMRKVEHQDNASLSEVLELYDRLQDPKTREAFLQRLHELGAQDSSLLRGLEHLRVGDGLDQNLLEVLLKAERASLAMGMAFVSERDLRGRRVRGARGLQLVLEKDWPGPEQLDSSREVTARDFAQGFKELLTLLTSEGIRPEQVAYGEQAGRAQACACVKDSHCETLLWVRLVPKGDELEPLASVEFRDALEQRCSNPSAPAPETIAGQLPLRVECAAPKTAEQCANDRLKAASQLLTQLSYRFSIFGDVAFLPVDRKVETISQTFHEGVAIDEMPSPSPSHAPDLLQRGLRIENHGCAGALLASLTARLQKTYAEQIGEQIGNGGRALLTLTDDHPLTREGPQNCTLRLLDANKTPAYGLTVRYTGPGKAANAGEDAGRTVGQLYYSLQQAKYLVDRGRAPELAYRPSPWSSFFVAGAPFLADDRTNNDGWGWAYAGLDTVGLACGSTFAILSVNARNQAETGGDASFKAAQTFLGLTYGCLGASLAARLASTVHYTLSKP